MIKSRPAGIVRLFERGRLLWESRNLFVNSGLPALASLLAGATAGEFAAAVGFGSGATAPTVNDTDLTSAPKYYNAIGSYSFPSPGSVQFNYLLAPTADYAASGITILEMGLYANLAAVALPAAVGTGNPGWTANLAEAVGNLIVDSNGNIQRCTTAGTSGTAAPAWAASIGAITNDGSVLWTLAATHTAPGPMLAHALVPSFIYNGSAAYQGTWTFTF